MNGGVVCMICLFVLLAIGGMVWRASRGQDILDSWAEQNGFEIVSRDRRSVVTGPYFFSKTKGQDVYYVTVQYPDGKQRSGYVRVGGAILGMVSDAVDVTWDA